MIPGYQIKKTRFQSGHLLFYEAVNINNQSRAYIEVIGSDYPSLDQLVGLKNDFEITRDEQMRSALRSTALVKYASGMALVKEFFEGVPLNQFSAERKLSIPEILNIAIQLASVLEEVHSRSIIHKDINPSNFLVSPDLTQIKLASFSLASVLAKEQAALTTAEPLRGSLFYISPEQTGRMNRSIDYRTDFYSLGITLYQLFCGILPFGYPNLMELVHAHIAKNPPEPSQVDHNIPQMLSDVVMKLMAKNAEDRYQSARGLKEDLQQCLQLYAESGKIHPFEAGKNDYSPTFILSEKLYGRDEESRRLTGAFEKARKESIQLLLVSGYSGIGKTRLINEIYKPIAKENGYFAAGKFEQFSRNIPYSAITHAFGNLIRQFLAENKSEFERWSARIKAALEDGSRVLVDVIPELELLIGLPPSVLKLGLSESQTRFFNLFSNFVRALASEEHPLVIFLDDMQWADSGSLELLFQLLHQDFKHTLLIGAYRDNEVSASHPLMLMLERLKSKKSFDTITLHELTPEQANQLIADSLRQDTDSTFALTEAIMAKTRGNPFFINQFLQKLVDEKNIVFDFDGGGWKWNLDEIRRMNITDNVVDLLVSKIQTLPQPTQDLLQLAACIGSRFDLDELVVISEKENDAVGEALWVAVTEDVLNITGQRSHHYNDQFRKEFGLRSEEQEITAYQFQHDRIQQAAYSMIPEEERKKTHLRIGRLLLNKLSAEELEENVFGTVAHFNLATELLDQKEERIQVARLNLLAAGRAKNSNSYQPALSYLRSGMEIIRAEDEEKLFSDFLIGRSECEYLCGNYAESEQMYDIALSQAKTNLERAEVFARKMQLYENTSRHQQAIRSALEGLKLLGIRLPEKPGQLPILTELMKAKFYLRGKKISDLQNNIDLQSPELILSMKILMNLWGPAYLHNQNLLALAILRMVNISTRFGNSPESALAYTFYGFVSCAQLKDFKGGYEFGKLGLWLNEKFDHKALRAKVYVIFAGCIAHWKDGFASTLDHLRTAHAVGIEANDLIYSGYALNFLSKNQFLLGEPLSTVYSKFKGYVHFGRKIHHTTTLHHLLAETRAVCQLMGLPEDPAVFMEHADQATHEKAMEEFAKKEGVELPITAHHIYEAEWQFLTGNYSKALEHISRAKKTIASMLGLVEEVRLNFCHSMSLLSLASSSPKPPEGFLKTIKANQAKLKKWAAHAPENFNSWYLLVKAEEAACEKRFEPAAGFFAKAKEAARQNNLPHHLALICERSARFYYANGFTELGLSLMRESILNYRQWGATAKVTLLEEELASRTAGESAITFRASTSELAGGEATSSFLDLQSIFKASTTISGEVVLEELLGKLMKIVLENAGAQNGSLVLVQRQQLVVAARAESKDEVKILDGMVLEQANFLSQSIVQLVYHTMETIILHDAGKDERFSRDAYLVAAKPKSVLCQPVMQSGKCVAIIYLENKLAAGAFTPARREVLNLLSGQIAVSMENAQLYKRQKELSDAYQRFVPHDFINALGHQSILEVKLGESISQVMTVMFCDIRSYTTLAEGMSVAENFHFINSYHNLVGPIIKKHQGFINHYLGDGFVALFKDYPENALNAALEIMNQLRKYNEEQKKKGELPISLGIGLHTGQVMMGIIGDRERHDAGVISDAVNAASRLEGLTRHFGANVIISDSTMDGIKNTGAYQFRHLGRIRVKGREQALMVNEAFDGDEKQARQLKSETLELFNSGMTDYLSRRFAEAAVSFRKVMDLNPDDVAAKRYLQHTATLMVTGVPENWDGSEAMSVK